MRSVLATGPAFDRLTKADVERLLKDPSDDQRSEVARKVADQYKSGDLSATERHFAEDIFRSLVRDTAVRVREALSEHLKDARNAPRDIALELVRDVESVALPMIRHSDVLNDQDLVELVGSHNRAKQLAVAGRTVVPTKVSEALIETSDEEVVAALVGNAGAQLDDASLNRIMEVFPDSPAIHEPLAERELPVGVAERLVGLVSYRLREYLIGNYDLPRSVVNDIAMQTRERATLGLVGTQADGATVERLIRRLHQNGRLTPSIVLRALCQGDFDFFETAMSVLARVSRENANVLIYDRGPLGFKTIYDRAGLPQPWFAAFREAVLQAQLTDRSEGRVPTHFPQVVLGRICAEYKYRANSIDELIGKLAGG